jgi:glycosyltransferase involved in cell wall biosynthesis
MNAAPKVSIAIPFLNDRPTLGLAVQSVFAQTEEDWELLLLDDGSADGSWDMLRDIRDPRVRMFRDGVNRGLPVRLNQATELARAPLIARMDADDLMHPLRLERQLSAFASDSSLDALDGAIYTIDEHNALRGIRGNAPLDPRPATVLRRGLFTHPAVMARRAWMLANPYDPGIVRLEDLDLWFRTCARARFGRLSTPILFYRERRSVRLRAVLKGSRAWRRLALRAGPGCLGWPGTARLLGEIYARDVLYICAAACRRPEWVIDRRNRVLDDVERADALAALEAIRKTAVDGLALGGPGSRDGGRVVQTS